MSPTELEAALLGHPEILDAAIIGVKVDGSELPFAFVVRAVDTLLGSDIQTFLDARLARYKRLDGGIQFVDAIPKTATGKVLRDALRKKLLA